MDDDMRPQTGQDDARAHFEGIERVALAGPPTPLQRMARLEAALASTGAPCPQLYVKRDDLTHAAGGGNKVRKLEYLLADACARDADVVITAGAIQSNHVRQTAGAAARLGLGCIGVLFRTVPIDTDAYTRSGNYLLDEIFGADLRIFDATANGAEILSAILEEQLQQGHRPHVIPVGGSNAIGCLGYVRCAMELAEQARDLPVPLSHVVTANGSAGTHAGLEAGCRLFMPDAQVHGIAVLEPDGAKVRETVATLASATLTLAAGAEQPVIPADEITVHEGFVGPGYGIPIPEMAAAVRLAARTEGLLLDPVYSGKAMAGLVGLVQAGRFSPDEAVVFLATGGLPGLFAYVDSLQGPLAEGS